jgi:hypothetical protein
MEYSTAQALQLAHLLARAERRGHAGEHSGNIQGEFREHSGRIQAGFGEHSGNIQLLKLFNSRTCQLVLGAGDMQVNIQ